VDCEPGALIAVGLELEFGGSVMSLVACVREVFSENNL